MHMIMASKRKNTRTAKEIVRNLTIAKDTAESLFEDEEDGKLTFTP